MLLSRERVRAQAHGLWSALQIGLAFGALYVMLALLFRTADLEAWPRLVPGILLMTLIGSAGWYLPPLGFILFLATALSPPTSPTSTVLAGLAAWFFMMAASGLGFFVKVLPNLKFKSLDEVAAGFGVGTQSR